MISSDHARQVKNAGPMLSYDTLDAIADSINPALGVIALLVPWMRRKGTRYALALDALTLLAVAVAYAVQTLDSQLGLWSRAGLDFSTHTAVFIAIASSLWQENRAWQFAAALLGFGYAALMLYQHYHSWLDITSTAAVMLLPLTPLWWRATKLPSLKKLSN